MAVSAIMPSLTIQTAQQAIKLELTAQAVWTFGRGAKNTVRLEDPFASRYHAKLQVHPSHQCYFVDLNSRNGTLLNDEPLTTPVWLKHGDRISIGETTLIFEQSEVGLQSKLEDAELEDSELENSELDSEETSFSSAEATSPSALMLHGAPVQAQIWQDIFAQFKIPLVWEESSKALKDTLEARAVSNTLPSLLLIDNQAHPNVYHVCRWCRQSFPQIQVFILDSVREMIPEAERKITQKQGALNFFPAMTRPNLVLRTPDRLKEINEVLAAVGEYSLSGEALLSILRRINGHR
ncbi:MAG: FHA domain-containing protein [Thermosynechococcaceae cyanobacterium MS004]|nr:FHA domain-containing protein [Thermosynechococcaceae cyanobacterium MS004]